MSDRNKRSEAYRDGFADGWGAALNNVARSGELPSKHDHSPKRSSYRGKTVTRKVSAAQKRYGREFKRLAPKYKKKAGGWKKDGFKNCAAAARRAAKK